PGDRLEIRPDRWRCGTVSTVTRPPRLTSTGHVSLSEKGPNSRKRQRRDRTFKAILTFMMVIASIPIVLVVVQVVQRGISVISWEFFTQPELPRSMEGGGYAAGFIGTFIAVTWA